MRHFSLFDGMDDGMKKQAADDQFYTINLGTESALLGLFDVLGWVSRNVRPGDFEGPDPQVIRELTDYVNDLYSSEDFVLRVDFGQLEQIRRAFYSFMKYAGQFEDREEFESLNSDVKVDDILEAEEALMMAQMDSSSNKGLEDIPTMEKNPEDLKEGELPTNIKEVCPSCGQGNTFSTVDEFGEVRCDNCGALDPNNMGDICPECSNENSITIDEFGERRCNNCGWAEEREHDVPEGPSSIPPVTPAAKNNVDPLEQAYNAPSAEHPLGPHTGAEEQSQGGTETYNGKIINAQKGWSAPAIWAVRITKADGQRDPVPGDKASVTSVNNPKPKMVTLTQHRGGMQWDFQNDFNQFQEQIQNTRADEPVAATSDESGREFYSSGGFTKGVDGSWLVYVRPAAGQRAPEPGDWAEVIQKSRSYTRPVPVTLVEDAGGAWVFKNGHHPDIGKPVTAAVEDFPHPHRQPAMQPKKRTRPGQVPTPPAICETPFYQPEPEQPDDDDTPWWKFKRSQ